MASIGPFLSRAPVQSEKSLPRKLIDSGMGVASSLLGNAVIFLIIAQAVGVAQFGLFAKTYATASLLALLVDFGYPQRILRDLDEYLESFGGVPARIIHLKIILVLVGCVLAACAYPLIDFSLELFPVIWAGLLMISFGQVAGVTLRGMESHGRDSINLFSASLAGSAWAFLMLIRQETDLLMYCLSFLWIGATYSILSYWAIRSKPGMKNEGIAYAKLRDELRRGVSYASDVLVVRSYGVTDVLILAVFASPAGVGIYQLGQKLMQVALPTAQIATNVLQPRLARSFRAGKMRRQQLPRMLIIFAGFAVFMTGVFVLATWVVQGFFLGEEYFPVWALIPAFCVTLGARLASVAPAIWLVAVGAQRVRLALNTLNFAVFVPLCGVLSWQYGEWGAALATAISAVSWITLYIVAAWRRSPTALPEGGVGA